MSSCQNFATKGHGLIDIQNVVRHGLRFESTSTRGNKHTFSSRVQTTQRRIRMPVTRERILRANTRAREINQTRRRRLINRHFPSLKSRVERAWVADRKLAFQRPTAVYPFCSISPIFRRLCIGLSLTRAESLVSPSNDGHCRRVFMVYFSLSLYLRPLARLSDGDPAGRSHRPEYASPNKLLFIAFVHALYGNKRLLTVRRRVYDLSDCAPSPVSFCFPGTI